MEIVTLTRAVERVLVAGTVPLLLFIGYRLFVLGATGKMTLSGRSDRWSGRLSNLSPGVFCFVLSVIASFFILRSTVPLGVAQAPPHSTMPTPVLGSWLSGSSGSLVNNEIARGLLGLVDCVAGGSGIVECEAANPLLAETPTSRDLEYIGSAELGACHGDQRSRAELLRFRQRFILGVK